MQAILDGSAHALPASCVYSSAELAIIGSLSLLTCLDIATRVRYEGKVLNSDMRPRQVTTRDPMQSPRKRNLRDGEEVNVACDLLLADNTGPVMVTLWGKLVNDWYASGGHSATPFMTLEAMRVGELSKGTWNGPSLSAIRVLHSTHGSTLTMSSTPTSTYLVSATYTPPTSPVCESQFMSLHDKLVAPFRVTLRGFVSDLSEMLLSQQESTKRTFHLVDRAGMWIRCCAIGLSATSRALADGNEVVLYYGTGRSGIGSSPGMVYLLKDSLVVEIGRPGSVATKRGEIHVTG